MAFEITILRFVCLILMCFLCLAQQVLTRVLEEAGYTQESLLVMSDFAKVNSPLYLMFLFLNICIVSFCSDKFISLMIWFLEYSSNMHSTSDNQNEWDLD